jgi:hypothetical protein
MQIEVKIEGYPQQMDVLGATEEEVAFIGGVGCGKTHVGAMSILDRMLKHPGANALVTAPSYRILDMATIPKYDLLFPPQLIKRKKTRPYPEWELITGGHIYFFSTDKPEGIVGGEVAFAHMDEASLSPYLAYTNVKKRMRQRGKDGLPFPYQMWITTTPKQLNWVYLEFAKPAQGKKLVQASTRDNSYRTRDEIDAYIEKLHLNEAEMRQEIEGSFELLAGSCLFDKDSLDRQLLECHETLEVREGCISIYKYPVVGVRYVAGADCAGDDDGDSSDLVILDAQTGEEVAELYAGNGMPADVFSRKSFNLLNEYNNPLFAPERNGTVGGVIITKLLDMGYPKLYINDKGKEGWYTTANAIPPKVGRLTMLKEYEEAVRLRRTVVHSSDAIGEMSTFIMNKTGKYCAMGSCHDDRVMARAITWQMRKQKEHHAVSFMSVRRMATTY